jgi:sigma-B regulation protein RsbU (phosphoserine phosphatase)
VSRDQLDQELASAADMQRLILPQSLPQVEDLSFAAHYETSRHVGGDYYDVVCLPDKRYGILIVDVSGHGAPSAIVMAMIRAVFHSLPVPGVDPPSVLQFINRHFRSLWDSSMLATALYAVVDPVQRRMQVACAGHLPPVLLGGILKLNDSCISNPKCQIGLCVSARSGLVQSEISDFGI